MLELVEITPKLIGYITSLLTLGDPVPMGSSNSPLTGVFTRSKTRKNSKGAIINQIHDLFIEWGFFDALSANVTFFFENGGVVVGGKLDYLDWVVEVWVEVVFLPLSTLETFSLACSKLYTKLESIDGIVYACFLFFLCSRF